jgi:adenylate cyclase
MIVVAGFAAPLASLRLRVGWVIAASLALAALIVVGGYLAFEAGLVVKLVNPLVALAAGTVGALGVHYVGAAVDRQRTRDLFSRFVPAEVVNDLMDRTDGELRLGGVRRESTVMFSDLRGFTRFAETLEPDQVIDVLNRYLTAMSDVILDHGGTLVAYMGDGIMAVFGAPLNQDDHADRAIAAAREMVGPALGGFNQWLHEQGFGEGFRMGIGLNTGTVMSGNVGSERRLEYTAIGDTTNTAARIEAMTKGTPHQVLLAAATYEALRGDPEGLVFHGEMTVRGREAPVTLWGLEEEGAAPGEE